jgi:oligopeptidase A
MNQQPNFQPKNIVKTIQKMTKKGRDVVKQCEAGKNWQTVIEPLDEFEIELGQLTSVNSHLNAVMFDDEFNAQYEKTLPIISNFYADIASNKALYKAYKNLKNTDLNAQQRHILKEALSGFELSGVGLEGEKSERYKAIQARLSLLSSQFSNNILKATNDWKKIVKKSDLKGYGDNELAKIKTKNGYELSLQVPVYMDAMTYLDNRQLRQEIYQAYVSRAAEIGITSKDFDNKPLMDEILTLRQEMANILGFEHYAQLSIESKMVENVEQILDFLADLVEKSKPQAQAELQELREFADVELKPWDLGFYSEQLKEKKFGFKKSTLTAYFPEKKVLAGLYSTIEKLYQVKVEVIDEASYHADVLVLDISKNQQHIGKIYLDLYARKNKRAGAWMADYQPLNGAQKPIAFVVCNLNSPSENKPALFEFDEIVTIFHEFGHALHHLLTKVEYPCAAGIAGVPWDGVELPSQYMEFFCYEYEVVMKMSEHYQSGEKLPDELYEKLIDSKNFQSAMSMLRQCEFSLWDLQTHRKTADTYAVLDLVRQKTALIPTIDENRFLNTFSHIFSGGYAAGYFSYKWAEVLAADAYEYVQKGGGIGSPAALKFLRCILETGGSQDFMTSYLAFRGKKPQIKALLKANAIVI